MKTQETKTARVIYSVFELNSLAKSMLEESFPPIWVQGEISNFVRPGSGHYYFSLKDERGQLRCVMFRGQNHTLSFQPENGMQVLLRGKLTLYTERGTFQLIADFMEEAGHGALQRSFERLKKKLQQAGLFDLAHKKPIPSFPRRIGVITSPTGAAIRDILTVLNRRAPMIPVIIYPSLVQGAEAADQLVQALALANERNECDVLVLARGGGSLEDLWPFNEERVAQAIFASRIPLVSGVGHEIDFTLADFVADKRAPTPSAAAELITPDAVAIKASLLKANQRLLQLMMQQLEQKQLILNQLNQRLRHPRENLQRLADQLNYLKRQLNQAMTQLLAKYNHQLATRIKLLNAVSPLQILTRGYAIATHLNSGETLLNAQHVSIGDTLKIRLNQGYLICTVKQKENNDA